MSNICQSRKTIDSTPGGILAEVFVRYGLPFILYPACNGLRCKLARIHQQWNSVVQACYDVYEYRWRLRRPNLELIAEGSLAEWLASAKCHRT